VRQLVAVVTEISGLLGVEVLPGVKVGSGVPVASGVGESGVTSAVSVALTALAMSTVAVGRDALSGVSVAAAGWVAGGVPQPAEARARITIAKNGKAFFMGCSSSVRWNDK
jgi:hypothetical protein